MLTCAPTESSPGSRCWSRKSRQVYSTSLTMRGVAYTMPSLPMKPMQRASSTRMVFENDRSGLSELFMAGGYKGARRRRNALVTPDTELAAIPAPAEIRGGSRAEGGESTPGASREAGALVAEA